MRLRASKPGVNRFGRLQQSKTGEKIPMTSELYGDITKKHPADCGSATGPDDCARARAGLRRWRRCNSGVPRQYSGRMDEKTREQLSQPVASMDDAARLATIKALGHYTSCIELHGESEECGEFGSLRSARTLTRVMSGMRNLSGDCGGDQL